MHSKIRVTKKALIILFFILFIFLFGFFTKNEFLGFITNTDKPNISIAGTKIFIEIADTPEARNKGLSGRVSLGKNEGMLFVYQKDVLPIFWMKDMSFAIDIIWINNESVVGISENIQPEPGKSYTELMRYYPPGQVDHVLEVNAGFSQKHGIKVGDNLIYSNP